MILYLFRGQYLIRYIFLFLFTLLLWSDVLIFPEILTPDGTFGHIDFIGVWIKAFPRVFTILFILILFLQALILNVIAEENRLVERNQLLVSAIYILMMSSTSALGQPNIVILINFFFILLLHNFFRLNAKEEPYGALFDTGFLVGISSLVFYPSITFLSAIFYTLLIFQFFRWREWLIPIIGFLTPLLFIATWYFWFNELNNAVEIWLHSFNPELPEISEIMAAEWLILVLFVMLFVMGAGRIIHRANESNVDIRKKYRITFFMIIAGISMLFFPAMKTGIQGAAILIPLAIFLASYTSTIKKIFYADLIFSLIILVVISNKLLNLL